MGDIIERVETAHDDDAESIITNERYNYISSIIQGCYLKKAARTMTTSDKIDRWVTNRFLALPSSRRSSPWCTTFRSPPWVM